MVFDWLFLYVVGAVLSQGSATSDTEYFGLVPITFLVLAVVVLPIPKSYIARHSVAVSAIPAAALMGTVAVSLVLGLPRQSQDYLFSVLEAFMFSLFPFGILAGVNITLAAILEAIEARRRRKSDKD